MKKAAIIPLLMIDSGKTVALNKDDVQIGALVLGILDDTSEAQLDSTDSSHSALSNKANSFVIHNIEDHIHELLSAILSTVQNKTLSQDGEKTRPKEIKDAFLNSLTKREKEVLSLVAQGNTNKEIAQKFFLSVKTIETHRRRIYRKLGIHNGSQATAYAIRHGLA